MCPSEGAIVEGWRCQEGLEAEQTLTQLWVTATRPTALRKLCRDRTSGEVPAPPFPLGPAGKPRASGFPGSHGGGTRQEGRKEAGAQPSQGHPKVADGVGTRRASSPPSRRETVLRYPMDRSPLAAAGCRRAQRPRFSPKTRPRGFSVAVLRASPLPRMSELRVSSRDVVPLAVVFIF